MLDKCTHLIFTELLQFLASVFKICKEALMQSRIHKVPKEKYIGLCAWFIRSFIMYRNPAMSQPLLGTEDTAGNETELTFQ